MRNASTIHLVGDGAGRSLGGARRLVGLERHYHCEGCGHDHASWSRVRTCPECGSPLAVAVIRRAAVAAI